MPILKSARPQPAGYLAALCVATTLLAGVPALATTNNPTLCVWDPIGASGPLYDAAKTYALAMQKQNVDIRLKAYTDERVASEDFRVGQCDALMATSLRTKHFHPLPAAIDYGGTATIVRDGKVDMEASYEVVHKAINLFASAGAAKLAVRDRFELGGILPTGAVYTFVRDRNLFKKGFTGARLPAFEIGRASWRERVSSPV